MRLAQIPRLLILLAAIASAADTANAELRLEVEQITKGPANHFFGYIGQSLTIPWNASGRYIVALRTGFHDRMPQPGETADVVLIDTQDANRVLPVEQTRAWNFQQGTMFYWHPRHAETQLFFNDRDPLTQCVFTVLYDVASRRRMREYRFDDVPVANGGVSPTGEFFLAINYARMARLRPVTGYPGTSDPTSDEPAPDNDGVFRVDVGSGRRTLLVSFRQLRDLIQQRGVDVEHVEFYINHSLCNRDGTQVYFYARGRRGEDAMAVNVPCSVGADGRGLTTHRYLGGHPEWDAGPVVIGAQGDRQVRYDVIQRSVVGQIGSAGVFPSPGADIALSPDTQWLANGYSTNGGKQNRYVLFRRTDAMALHSPPFSRGPYQRGELRIDPAPRWNRQGDAILAPGVTEDGSRQLHVVRIVDRP